MRNARKRFLGMVKDCRLDINCPLHTHKYMLLGDASIAISTVDLLDGFPLAPYKYVI